MQQHCSYCKTVNTLCFWGPRREAKWKRPVLLILGVIMAAGCGSLAWLSYTRGTTPAFTLLGSALAFVGLLGALVAAHGCAACVARLLAEV